MFGTLTNVVHGYANAARFYYEVVLGIKRTGYFHSLKEKENPKTFH